MRSSLFCAATFVALSPIVLVAAGCRSAEGETVTEKRAYTETMRQDTLARLYRERPETRSKVASAAGYGVFSTIGMKLILASSNGFGVVRDNANAHDTYMKMKEYGLGIGLGVKDNRIVIIFRDRGTMNTFTESGWEWGGDADAAAQYEKEGAAANVGATVVGPMEIYVLTEAGVALQATVTGTKYYKDDDMN